MLKIIRKYGVKAYFRHKEIFMAETQLTKDLKKAIWFATKKMGVFGCFEVTIGFYGKERVDYMTLDTKGNWRCYEIKISKSDFHSKAKNTFVGHYNYYVMPPELYEEVKDEIPSHIGVFIGNNNYCYCKKNAKKQIVTIDEDILKISMIRSMNRDVEKNIKSSDINILNRYKKKIEEKEKELQRSHKSYFEIRQENIGLREKIRELENQIRKDTNGR
jgi:hypothetical protein